MRKIQNHIILLVLSLLAIAFFISCGGKNSSEDTFGIEKFKTQMKEKNYKFVIKDVQQDFLPADRKRMTIGNEAIDIYIFTSNKNMENEAAHIDSSGSQYNDGSHAINVNWVMPPHFYKRGNIIVQYVGKSEKIISDLKDILGKQFAGMKYGEEEEK